MSTAILLHIPSQGCVDMTANEDVVFPGEVHPPSGTWSQHNGGL